MSAIAQLREQEEPLDPALLRAALDACSKGLAVVENGVILYANRAFGMTLQFPWSSELRGRLLADLLPENTRYLNSRTQFSLADDPVQIEASTFDFEESQRSFQVICIRSVPRRDGSDVSAWESQKMEAIGRHSAGLAHDFNNLLTIIMLYADMLIAGLKADSRLRHHADAIRKAGMNGLSLIQQLMSPSREKIIAMQPLSWNQVLSEMASLLTRLVEEKIEIQTKLAEPLDHVKMDPGQVRRIILNLVLNARYAMPKGGKITLSTRNCTARFANSKNKGRRSIRCVEFAVADTGTGMDEKTLAQAFRPFFTTKPPSHGNGLGLTMVRDVVKQAGGEVKVESESGKGTRVAIRIPRIEVPDELGIKS